MHFTWLKDHARISTMLAAVVLTCLMHTTTGEAAGEEAAGEEHILQPGQKWQQCISDGRMNIIFSVESTGKLYSGLAIPSRAKKCDASKPSSCKMLLSCDACSSCHRFFPGEVSGREKCLVIMNNSNFTQTAVVTVVLESPGNWGAIMFGVVASSCGLLGVMAAGCYADVAHMLAGHTHKQQRSRRLSKAVSAAGNSLGGG